MKSLFTICLAIGIASAAETKVDYSDTTKYFHMSRSVILDLQSNKCETTSGGVYVCSVKMASLKFKYHSGLFKISCPEYDYENPMIQMLKYKNKKVIYDSDIQEVSRDEKIEYLLKKLCVY